MSRENTELVHAAYEALNRHDLDALVALSDPEMEFLPLLLELEGAGPLHGPESLRCWFDDLLGAFPDWGIDIVELREIGNVTLINAVSHGHGTESSVYTRQPFWQVTDWRDGKAVWWHNYLRESEAVEAARARVGDTAADDA
jgi:SnoaL-like protein